MVGAKIAIGEKSTGKQIAEIIDAAEKSMRDAVPAARVIYLEPDILNLPAKKAPVVKTRASKS
jgi:hypothetical protein